MTQMYRMKVTDKSLELRAEFTDAAGNAVPVTDHKPSWDVDKEHFDFTLSADGLVATLTPKGKIGWGAVSATYNSLNKNFLVQVQPADPAHLEIKATVVDAGGNKSPAPVTEVKGNTPDLVADLNHPAVVHTPAATPAPAPATASPAAVSLPTAGAPATHGAVELVRGTEVERVPDGKGPVKTVVLPNQEVVLHEEVNAVVHPVAGATITTLKAGNNAPEGIVPLEAGKEAGQPIAGTAVLTAKEKLIGPGDDLVFGAGGKPVTEEQVLQEQSGRPVLRATPFEEPIPTTPLAVEKTTSVAPAGTDTEVQEDGSVIKADPAAAASAKK